MPTKYPHITILLLPMVLVEKVERLRKSNTDILREWNY